MKLTLTRSVLGGLVLSSALAGPAGAGEAVILDQGSLWRTAVVFRTPTVVMADGKVERRAVDTYTMKMAPKPEAAPFAAPPPPAGWTAPDFDDGGWPRHAMPLPVTYIPGGAVTYGYSGDSRRYLRRYSGDSRRYLRGATIARAQDGDHRPGQYRRLSPE